MRIVKLKEGDLVPAKAKFLCVQEVTELVVGKVKYDNEMLTSRAQVKVLYFYYEVEA